MEIVYVSYDRFPAPKGAAVHIDAFAHALGDAFGPIDLVTVATADNGANSFGRWDSCPAVRHFPLPVMGRNLIERVLYFRSRLREWWQGRRPQVAHVRSIFEGYPLARNKRACCDRFVFEVNGLPSIELKYHYPDVALDCDLMRKLHEQEQTCLAAADLIITVSAVNAEHLVRRGVDPGRIRVIPNGVDPAVFPYRRPRRWNDRPVRLLYCGTLSSWQGVLLTVEALSLYRHEFPARLTVVGEGRRKQWEKIDRRCRELGVRDSIDFVEPVSQARLAQLHHECDIVVAPLKPNDRNLEQGCCPLKVLEAMASGTPLITSDMPVVRALARNGMDALLVKPGSAKAICEAMRRLRNDPRLATQLSACARRRVKQHFTWQHAQTALVEAYRKSCPLR